MHGLKKIIHIPNVNNKEYSLTVFKLTLKKPTNKQRKNKLKKIANLICINCLIMFLDTKQKFL